MTKQVFLVLEKEKKYISHTAKLSILYTANLK